MPPRGFIFGKDSKGYVVKPEDKDGHIMVVGGVGSGKSTRIAMPTLKAWQSRIFAVDIKGELSNYAKKHRQNIKVFNPKDKDSYGYDPYAFLRQSGNVAQEARAIAQAIIPLPPENKDTFWIDSAQTMLTGAILHYFGEGYSFIDTLKEIQTNGSKSLIETVSQSPSEKARICVGGFVDMADKTLSSVFAELSRGIVTLVLDDDVVSALSRTQQITPDDLEYGHDIFLTVPEHLLRQWKNLLSLIINQFLSFFEQRSEKEKLPQILFLLDEFPRLGKIPFIIDALSTLRSKKITICLMLQSLAQLDMIYGQNERRVMADTCSFKAVLSATDPDTQEYFSRLVGTYDKVKTTTGKGRGFDTLAVKETINETTEERRRIKPEDFATLEHVVFLAPRGVYQIDKVPLGEVLYGWGK